MQPPVARAQPVERTLRDHDRVGLRSAGLRETEQRHVITDYDPIRGAVLAANAYKAFLKAKELAMAELQHAGRLSVTLPWVVAEYQATKALMGDDYWSYGIAANKREFEALSRYAVEQGLAKRPVTPQDLFAASTLELARF